MFMPRTKTRAMVYSRKVCRKPQYIVAFLITVSILCYEIFLTIDSNPHALIKVNQSHLNNQLKFENSVPSHFLSTRKNKIIDDGEKIHLMFIYFHASHQSRLKTNVRRCLSSLLGNTASHHITIHVFGDEESFLSFQGILEELKTSVVPKVVTHALNSFPHVEDTLRDIHNDIGQVNQNHDFSHPFFYISLFVHKLLPDDITRLIFLDTDIIFKSDVVGLYSLFNEFNATNIIGIARENQPTYRYMFYEFRQENPGTRIGEPPPNGLTGFNSGVVLLDLRKMRESSEYNNLLSNGTLYSLSRKYKFRGNLGDQDVLSLISLEHEHLFYILPCGWNRQMCKWWQKADFETVFDLYFSCHEEIHILHGNCQTKI